MHIICNLREVSFGRLFGRILRATTRIYCNKTFQWFQWSIWERYVCVCAVPTPSPPSPLSRIQNVRRGAFAFEMHCRLRNSIESSGPKCGRILFPIIRLWAKSLAVRPHINQINILYVWGVENILQHTIEIICQFFAVRNYAIIHYSGAASLLDCRNRSNVVN